jgi:XTP/dITP diphosphohydrolase
MQNEHGVFMSMFDMCNHWQVAGAYICSMHAKDNRLVIASDNKGKIKEIREIITGACLLSLSDVGFDRVIDEPFHTFAENAHAKANALYQHCGLNVFADDSGICVAALDGRPGVDSAHYSGNRNDEQNLQQVLREMEGVTDRRAWYMAVICLIWEGETYYFEGRCDGALLHEKRGMGGFGYDPIFVPDGYDQTFGELEPAIKNAISHRGKAVRQMAAFVNEQWAER